MNLLTKMMQFVVFTTKKYKIDESHGLSHSMNVLHFAHSILEEELPRFSYLQENSQKRVIYASAILHDMCDNKYMDVEQGLNDINEFLQENGMKKQEIDAANQIINTMSYSKVKANGFPDLGNYMKAYHIVREADLLAAYDFDRCMIYNMYNKPEKNADIVYAFSDAYHLFQNRVFKHEEDGLLTTQYAQRMHVPMKLTAEARIATWQKLIRYNIR